VPRLGDIVGQDRAVAILRAAMARGRVHHAYLFTGPPDSGKRDTALALAAALNCLEAPGEGCDACVACTKIAQGIHPDVVTLEREGAAQIVPIETIREVIARVGLPPHEAETRVFLIDEANALQPAAANALLKTLEEPPRRTMFILATVAPDQLLPTIRSRCQRVAFAARPIDVRARAAGDDAGADRVARLADDVAALAGGPPGARELAAAIALAQRLAEEKGEAPAVLELALHRLAARARQASADGDLATARTCAERGRRILDAITALTIHNAHPQLTVEALLARLPALPTDGGAA